MAPKTSNEFIVKLDGLNRSTAATKALVGEIQGVVLRELARLDTGGDIRSHIPRKEWYGIWVERLRQNEIQNGVLQVTELEHE